jgi:hypothetical protein
MKTLTNFKDWSGSCLIISVPLPASLSVIGQFLSVSTPHWMQEKPYVRRVPLYFSVPLPGSRTRCHGQSLRFRVSEEGYSKDL